MNSLNQTIFYATIMLVAGLGIPVMAALNAGLGAKLQSPALAASILFLVAITASLGFLFLFAGVPKSIPKVPIPIYSYFGGLFVVFYILSITWVAPKFGVGNAVALVLLGQLISMAIIDHYSLLGAPHYPISLQRSVGLVFMAVGVFLAVRRF